MAVWLADLIEAAEVLAASAESCDPAIVKAFGHRLEMRADVRPPFDPAFAVSQGLGKIWPCFASCRFSPLVRSASFRIEHLLIH
jgi:hypothetical protein